MPPWFSTARPLPLLVPQGGILRPVTEPHSSQLSPQAQTSQPDRVSPARPDRRAAHILRLRRIEGQAKGLQRMVDEGQPCLDILTQLTAMTHALTAFGLALLDDHVRGGLGSLADGDPDELADELMASVSRFARM